MAFGLGFGHIDEIGGVNRGGIGPFGVRLEVTFVWEDKRHQKRDRSGGYRQSNQDWGEGGKL
jgi:hypothetical protein